MTCACDQPTGFRVASLAAVDPFAQKRGGIGGVDGGECDQVLSVHLTAAPVLAFKRRIAPHFETTNATVSACTKLAPEVRAEWDLFFQSWRAFLVKDVWFFDANEEWKATCIFARSLDAHVALFADAGCDVPIPKVAGPDTSVVKWVVGGVVALTIAVVVLKVL